MGRGVRAHALICIPFFYVIRIGGKMRTTSRIRTVRLGVPFIDGGRTISISRSRTVRSCVCNTLAHHIAIGEIGVKVTTNRNGEVEYWHLEHLADWKIILLDRDGSEITRFGC